MLKRIIRTVFALLVLAIVATPNSPTSFLTPVVLAGDDPGGGTGG